MSQSVGKGTTSTALASSTNPSTINQSVTFTATVSAPPGNTSLSGTVSFTDNGTAIASCTALAPSTQGKATCTTSTLALGTHPIVASYTGDANFSDSTSSTLSQVVNPASTSVSISSSASNSTVNQSVTFTATVSSTTGGTAFSGTMTFTDGSNTICSLAVDATTGVATCTDTSLTAGSHTITATYGGDTNFATSSKSLTQSVSKAASSLALASSANPSIIGDPVTLTATVSPSAGPVCCSPVL